MTKSTAGRESHSRDVEPRTQGARFQVVKSERDQCESGRVVKLLGGFGSMLGTSDALRRVYELIEKVAPTDTPVLLCGETGTGKELAAETIHQLSARADQPFLPVNCGAVSATLIESELFGHEKGSFTGADRQRGGYFEKASGGTILLDEIAEMPLELQVRLLRVLESGRILRVGGTTQIDVDVRVLAATNQDPEEAVRQGRLRADLLYRLRVFPIEMPPLRSRIGDVDSLTDYFLSELSREEGTRKTMTDEARRLLLEWHWPGNVRELKNVLHRAFILADETIDVDCLPETIRNEERFDGPDVHLQVGMTADEAVRRLTMATLNQMNGCKSRAAETLGISLKTLYNRLSKYEENAAG